MARAKLHVGLEIGTSKVGFVVGESRPDGGIKILGLAHTQSRGVRKGEIVDVEAAKQSINEALLKVEAESGHEVSEVYLAVTGGHVGYVNVSTDLDIPSPPGQVEVVDLEELCEAAREVKLPQDQALIHTIPRQFKIDGRLERNPVGQFGKVLKGDFHIIHGDRNRIHNSVRCVNQLSLGVADIVFSPLAAGHVVLGEAQKQEGAVLIDLGGGTTDYLLYADGSLIASGSIPLGGEHVTNDIALVLEIPLQAAESCKTREGSVYFNSKATPQLTPLPDVRGLEGREIDLNLLNQVIHLRVREILELVKQRLEATGRLQAAHAGVFLTGGGSLLKGMAELVGNVFMMKVNEQPEDVSSGSKTTLRLPQYATLIGLVRYAQVRERRLNPKKGAMSLGERIGGWLGVA